MNQLLFYLLQVIVTSGLLYGYYHFALRNKKFHRYNRFYLLLSVIISIVIPFLNIPVYFTSRETDSSLMLQTLQVISSGVATEMDTVTIASDASSQFSLTGFLYIFYATAGAILFVRILFSFNKIRLLIKNHTIEPIDKIKFVNTDEPGTPFSFFKWLFWNRKIPLHTEKGEQIFRHELFHIQQMHSWDIIFIELTTVVFWINPFFHVIRKEMKTIHEFLADEFAIKENNNWQYAELLLMQVLNTDNQLVNPFFHNQIKRRIAMITSSTKPSYQYLRKIMVLPIAAFVIFLFAFTYKNNDPTGIEKSINAITIVVDAGHGGTDKGAFSKNGKQNEAELSLAIAKKVQLRAPDYNINVVMTRVDNNFPGGATNKNDALRKRVEIANSSKLDAFISIHMNSTPSTEQTTKSGFGIYLSKNDKNADLTLASAISGELRGVYRISDSIKYRQEQGIFVLDKSNAPSLLLECGYMNNPNDITFFSSDKNQEDVARAILGGIVKFSKKIKKPDGGFSYLPYSQQIFEGTGDTIPIPARKSPTTAEFKSWEEPKMYGIWINANRINNNDLKKYKPSDFGWYNVSKLAKNAVNYGKHVYQVSLYTQKYYDEKIAVRKGKPTIVVEDISDTIKPSKEKPLIVINEMPVSVGLNEEINKLVSPENIESISVLKGKNATDKYGDKGKDGVIEIKTKATVVNEMTLENKLAENENTVFVKVEAAPVFPGGDKEWRKYLEKNLNPEIPKQYDCRSGTFTVVVQFIVRSDGVISSVEAKTTNGLGMEEHVVDLIRNGAKWLPAIQNGYKVSAYLTQPVTFVIGDGNPDMSTSVKYSDEPGLLGEIVVTTAGK